MGVLQCTLYMYVWTLHDFELLFYYIICRWPIWNNKKYRFLQNWYWPQSTYRGRVEIGGMYHLFSLSVHNNFVRDGRYNERGWACHHPHQAGLIFLSWNERQKMVIATLWVLVVRTCYFYILLLQWVRHHNPIQKNPRLTPTPAPPQPATFFFKWY